MNTKTTIQSELVKSLCRFSYGRISLKEAEKIAQTYAPKLASDKEALRHKSITYYAKQILQMV